MTKTKDEMFENARSIHLLTGELTERIRRHMFLSGVGDCSFRIDFETGTKRLEVSSLGNTIHGIKLEITPW